MMQATCAPKSICAGPFDCLAYFLFSIFIDRWSVIKIASFPSLFCDDGFSFSSIFSKLSFANFTNIVMCGMFPPAHKLKIIYAIIKGITINMMNNFILIKSAAKMSFHNHSMLKHFFAVMHNKPAPMGNPSLCVAIYLSDLSKSALLYYFWTLFVSFVGHKNLHFLIRLQYGSVFVNKKIINEVVV